MIFNKELRESEIDKISLQRMSAALFSTYHKNTRTPLAGKSLSKKMNYPIFFVLILNDILRK